MDATFSWDQLYANNLQLFALITGLLSVLLLIPVNHPRLQYLAWPFGIATSAAYFFVFKDDWQLYGSAALQVWFVVASIAGAYIWRGQLFGKLNHTPGRSSSLLTKIFGAEGVPTTYASNSYMLRTLLVTAVAAIPSYYILRELNDAAPNWDGLVFVGSMAAIWLQARKYVQNWYLWIAVDLVAIPFYYSQANLGLALLYLAYMLMCFWGLYTWRNDVAPPVPERYEELEMWPDPSLEEVPYGSNGSYAYWQEYWSKQLPDNDVESTLEQGRARFP
jgi:nicotinamide mononucleotide transporter